MIISILLWVDRLKKVESLAQDHPGSGWGAGSLPSQSVPLPFNVCCGCLPSRGFWLSWGAGKANLCSPFLILHVFALSWAPLSASHCSLVPVVLMPASCCLWLPLYRQKKGNTRPLVARDPQMYLKAAGSFPFSNLDSRKVQRQLKSSKRRADRCL
jgi:hypothetical protein